MDDPHRVPEIVVWDPLVRLFHWTLVIAFCVAYVSQGDAFEHVLERFVEGDRLQTLHTVSGYTVLGLLVFRLLWGFVGPQYARFSDFMRGPRAVWAYTLRVLSLRAERHIGHNPAGGIMIIALLLSLTAIVVSGLVVYGADKGLGLLSGLLTNSSDELIHTAEGLHEFFANITVILIVGHLVGVVWESLLHRENLAWAMFTGRKRGPTAE